MKIGLYFGSFNPIHNGHLIVANIAQHTTDLQQVWLVVSPQNPFKPSTTLLNEYHRLHLVQTAIENDNYLRVTDIEFHLPKPSYTVNTLAYLQEKYPQHEFAIIMGSDSFSNLPQWKNAHTIITNHEVYVYKRPGFEVVNTLNARLHIINAPLLEISSTQIRSYIQQNIPIRYMVPDKVEQEISLNNYYKKQINI
ncbi:MAG TPA: nicotinate (nicotinamide) nucleotide adenylyltransferase [Phnomibacter sp.]|nr:nicotinate (nicotinamide) nucleotide adenylyltransferase [Phnomibacter sp.]